MRFLYSKTITGKQWLWEHLGIFDIFLWGQVLMLDTMVNITRCCCFGLWSVPVSKRHHSPLRKTGKKSRTFGRFSSLPKNGFTGLGPFLHTEYMLTVKFSDYLRAQVSTVELVFTWTWLWDSQSKQYGKEATDRSKYYWFRFQTKLFNSNNMVSINVDYYYYYSYSFYLVSLPSERSCLISW